MSDENLISYQKLLDSGDPRIWRLSIDVEKTSSDKENYIINYNTIMSRSFLNRS